MPWRSPTIEKLLRLSLSETEYQSIIFWTDCLYKNVDKGTSFRHLVVGNEYLYTIDHAHWKLERECQINQIVHMRIAGDVAEFLRCNITRTYNHMVLVYNENCSVRDKQIIEEQNLKSRDCKSGDKKTNLDLNYGESDYSDMCVMKRLDFYLKDRNLIVFRILHETIRTYREQHSGFKFILKQLLDFPGSCSNLELSLAEGNSQKVDDRSISPRKSVILAFLAQDDDLIQLMPFFKPTVGCARLPSGSQIGSSTTCESYIKPDEMENWVLQWVNTSHRILTELHSFETCDQKPPLHLFGLMHNQLMDLKKRIQATDGLETGGGVVYLSTMTLILRELSNFLNDAETNKYEFWMEPEWLERLAKRRAAELELMLIMLDTIRLFVEQFSPTQSKSPSSESTVPLSNWYWKTKWENFITQVIPILLQPPRILFLPCCSYLQSDRLCGTNMTVCERCLRTELISVMIATGQWKKQTNPGGDALCLCSLFCQLISDMHTEVACILFEILAIAGSVFGPPSHSEPMHSWISTLFDESWDLLKCYDPLMLNRLSSHACAKLHLICIMQSESPLSCPVSLIRSHLEDIVRTLFLIDWLTYIRPQLREKYRLHGFIELLTWFRPHRVFSLFQWLRTQNLNVVEVRLSKCVIVALVSRIQARTTGRSKASWAEPGKYTELRADDSVD
ncbi:hypothetical protein D915_007080 [Fasciola hepatica]|uniref:Uncharacterized protein n=1 Tax=Fasciola hepatica TaxID=6192 RepID=A0A4E0RWK8_FASHE|nr:hypothetical protein D915_007080 [Fasciola hepatica]